MTVTASKYPLKKNDLYETEAWATDACCRALLQLGLWQNGLTIWEPAAGNHAMVKPFYNAGAKTVITSDICKYNFEHTAIFDFLENGEYDFLPDEFNIMTNPPYGVQNFLARKFAEKALERCDGFVALLLTATFDSGITRKHLFRDNSRFLCRVPLLDRISWEGNDLTGRKDHAWYIWGPRGYKVTSPAILYEQKLPTIIGV